MQKCVTLTTELEDITRFTTVILCRRRRRLSFSPVVILLLQNLLHPCIEATASITFSLLDSLKKVSTM